jgi:tricorn protease
VPVPVVAARYSGMQAGKDCLLWYRSPVSGVLGDTRAGTAEKAERPVLERYDLVRRKLDVIADPVTWAAVSGDGSRLVVRDGASLRVLRTDRPGSAAPGEGDGDEFEIDTRRIVVTVDPTAEWRQMFDEAGRLMRDHFWSPDMAGVDWDAEIARYRPLVDAVGSHDDLVDLMWELQGELGTSGAARCRSRAGRRRVAGGARAAPGDVGARGAEPAVGPGGGRAGRRRDPGGRWQAGRPRVRACSAARLPGRRARGAHRALRARSRGRGRGAPDRGASAAVGGLAALPGLGGR